MTAIRLSLCLLATFIPAAVLGCSSGDDQGNSHGGTTGDLSVFAAYCTGEMLHSADLMVPWGPGGWQSEAGLTIGAGSVILVGEDFDHWQGYTVMGDGTPAEVDADFVAGLVKDTDFTSDCAGDPSTVSTDFVVLRASTFHASADLSGAACTIPAATVFASYSFSLGSGGVATVSSPELQEACGYQTGYTSDLTYGSLVPR